MAVFRTLVPSNLALVQSFGGINSLIFISQLTLTTPARISNCNDAAFKRGSNGHA